MRVLFLKTKTYLITWQTVPTCAVRKIDNAVAENKLRNKYALNELALQLQILKVLFLLFWCREQSLKMITNITISAISILLKIKSKTNIILKSIVRLFGWFTWENVLSSNMPCVRWFFPTGILEQVPLNILIRFIFHHSS